jgi:hypothetical protein
VIREGAYQKCLFEAHFNPVNHTYSPSLPTALMRDGLLCDVPAACGDAGGVQAVCPDPVFSGFSEELKTVKWTVSAAALSTCVSKTNSSWKKSDVSSWKQSQSNDADDDGCATVDLVMECQAVRTSSGSMNLC